mmetsp:Transcript_48674/g.150303  ORF Transcript_48674/g.150303 Transcript_48674/m.150303 type:complete len:335 (+) Transcript_48674:295-1299(+)
MFETGPAFVAYLGAALPGQAAQEAEVQAAARAMDATQVAPILYRRCVKANVPSKRPGLRVPVALWLHRVLARPLLPGQNPHVVAILSGAVHHVLGPCRAGGREAAGEDPTLVCPPLSALQATRHVQAPQGPALASEGGEGDHVGDATPARQQWAAHLRPRIVDHALHVPPNAGPAELAVAARQLGHVPGRDWNLLGADGAGEHIRCRAPLLQEVQPLLPQPSVPQEAHGVHAETGGRHPREELADAQERHAGDVAGRPVGRLHAQQEDRQCLGGPQQRGRQRMRPRPPLPLPRGPLQLQPGHVVLEQVGLPAGPPLHGAGRGPRAGARARVPKA